ncbi:MAG: hypothetical protein R6X22_05260 [Gemmatimonadota bacterium]
MRSKSRVLRVGELVATLAVVLSVIFVGIEIRQNSEAQIRAATQAAVSDYIGSLERITDNGDVACLYVKGVQDYHALSGSERLRFSAFYMSFYYQLQQMHRLAEEGSIDAETWSGFEGLLRETTRYPGVRQWFEVRRSWFGPAFQAYIDGLMRESPPLEDYLFADVMDPACS